MKKKQLLIIFATVLLFKILLASYFMQLAQCAGEAFVTLKINEVRAFSIEGGDSFSYLGSIDNFIEEGSYYFWNGSKKVYAGRMPYYGSFYFVFRAFFEKGTALNLLILFQILVDAAALVIFALFCYEVLESKRAFWTGLVLYLLSFNMFLTSLFTAVESLGVSFIIFFLFFYHRYYKTRVAKWLLFASIFLALSTVLRPSLFVIYPLIGLSLLLEEKKISRIFFRKAFLLSIPLILLLSPWIIRNAIVFEKFIPAQENTYAGYDYKSSLLAVRRFVNAWGADEIWNFGRSKDFETYFAREEDRGLDFDKNTTLPATAYTDGYTKEEVENVRQKYIKMQNEYSPELDAEVTRELDRLTGIYRRERPFMYYVVSPILITKKSLLHTNSQFLQFFIYAGSACYQSWHIIFKIVQAIIYLSALFFGFIGLIYLTVRKKISPVYLFIPVALILFVSVYVNFTESRNFYYNYPLLILGLTAVINSFINLVKSKFMSSNNAQESLQS